MEANSVDKNYIKSASTKNYVDWSNIFNTHESYVIITKPEEVQAISQAILKTKPDPILGVDCEGLSKGRPLSLLQMYFAGKCYLFDLLSVNPFLHGLKEVMESKTIIKIFHDFCEDQSALINQYNLNCYYVFDTQIAHRVIQQAIFKQPKLQNYNDNNISLANLLQKYIDVVHTKKHEISLKMRNDDMFWERRPLTQDMIDYATQDVCYLPMVYQKLQKEYGQLELYHTFYQNGQQYMEKMTVFQKIMRDTANCQRYAFINRHIQDVSQIQDGAVIQAFIKNYQEYGVYCSLNVGVSGIVQEDSSVKQLRQYFDIGDIIQVQVDGQRKTGHLRLRFQGPQNPSMFIPPHGFKPNNVKPSDYSYGPVHQQQPQQQMLQSQMNQYQRQHYQSTLGFSHSMPNQSQLNMQSPLYYYQQNANMYQNNKKNQKSMNIQSPAFVPNTSCSGSSNGDNTLNNTFNSDWAQYNIGGNTNNNSSTSSLVGANKNLSPNQQQQQDNQDIPFNLGYSYSSESMKSQIQQQFMMGMNQPSQFKGQSHTYNTQKSVDKKQPTQFQQNNFYRPQSNSNDLFSNSQFYHEDFKKSSSFVIPSTSSANQNNGNQRLFQMKVTQEEFMYKPQRMQSTRDETQNIQYGFTQGAQGGQVKAGKSSPTKQAQLQKTQTAATSGSTTQSDKQEIMSLLNDTIAKLSITQTSVTSSVNNNGSQQLKIVGGRHFQQ